MIKYIVYAIAMCMIGGMTGYLRNQNTAVKDIGQDGGDYVLKFPRALTGIFLAVFIIGMLSFAFVAVSRLMGTPSATIGLIRVSLGFAAAGLIMMLWATAWRISVTGEQMEVHRLWRGTLIVKFAELERVEVTERFQLILYRDGRRLVTVDLLTENYERFKDTLENCGKLNGQVAGTDKAVSSE